MTTISGCALVFGKKTVVCITMEMSWLPWARLRCCPVRWDAEEGVHNGSPLLEKGGDHLQTLWTQQLEQLEANRGREWGNK